jgi:hypothetical protein
LIGTTNNYYNNNNVNKERGRERVKKSRNEVRENGEIERRKEEGCLSLRKQMIAT